MKKVSIVLALASLISLSNKNYAIGYKSPEEARAYAIAAQRQLRTYAPSIRRQRIQQWRSKIQKRRTAI